MEAWGNLYLENFAQAGFFPVDADELKVGDCFLMQVAPPVPNHAAVYLGDGLILHHLQGRLSSRDVYGGNIEACLRETPFDDLVDRLTNRDDDLGFPAGGGVPINVIPGAHKLACTALTLALAKGISAGSRLGFPNVMRTVRAYLIDCERIAKAVVLLTDTWSPRHTEEHLREIYAHARQGRYVIPHLVTGDRIHRVEWPMQPRV